MLEDRAGARAPSADGTRSRYSSTPIPPAPRREPAGGAAPGKARRTRATPVAALGPPRGRHRKPREVQGAGVFRIVPDAERTGAPRQQGMLWAGNNLTAVNLVLGGVASAGLGFWPAVLAITAGAAAGAAVLGLLAAQGPRLGVPQLVHARALLGSSGSAVLSGGVLLLTTGFGAAQLVIQGDALREVSGWPEPVLILACTVPAALLALDGLGLPPGEVVNTLQAFFGGFASAVPVLACMTLEALLLPEVLEQCRAHTELVPARPCESTFAAAVTSRSRSPGWPAGRSRQRDGSSSPAPS